MPPTPQPRNPVSKPAQDRVGEEIIYRHHGRGHTEDPIEESVIGLYVVETIERGDLHCRRIMGAGDLTKRFNKEFTGKESADDLSRAKRVLEQRAAKFAESRRKQIEYESSPEYPYIQRLESSEFAWKQLDLEKLRTICGWLDEAGKGKNT